MRAAFVLTLGALMAAPASAQLTFVNQPSQAAPATSAKTANPKDKMICEREEEIGTRLGGKKVCKTASQWDEERRQQRENVEKVQQMGTASGHSG